MNNEQDETELDEYMEESDRMRESGIESLVDKAQKFYPHEDTAKALGLFMEAIRLVGPAPLATSAQEARDHSSVGHAFWAAWVCLELLERPDAEFEELIEFARVKSPASAVRLEENWDHTRTSRASERQKEEAWSTLIDSESIDSPEQREALESLRSSGPWWSLRDLGSMLLKDGKLSLAWEALSNALVAATTSRGNVPSIYSLMGDLRKAEGRHDEAARFYLLSCIKSEGTMLKRSVDQLRISLKKAGVRGDPVQIRDELLEMRSRESEADIVARLDNYLLAGRVHP